MNRLRLVRKAKFVERLIKQHTGVITRERTPCRIRPMKTRSEADDDQTRLAIAERCDGRAVVVGILLPPFFQEGRQSRAVGTGAVEDDAIRGPQAVRRLVIGQSELLERRALVGAWNGDGLGARGRSPTGRLRGEFAGGWLAHPTIVRVLRCAGFPPKIISQP